MYTDKRRDMARSVLPSRARARARAALAGVRRHHRRAVARELYRLRGPLDDASVVEFDLGVHERYPDHLVRDEVRARRDADKVAPLVRWAVVSTARLRLEDRLSHLAAMLPADLIGAHALSHLGDRSELTPDGPHRFWWHGRRGGNDADPVHIEAETMATVLTAALEREHAYVNRLLKDRGLPPLQSIGDVQRLVEGVRATPRVKSDWRTWVPEGMLALRPVVA